MVRGVGSESGLASSRGEYVERAKPLVEMFFIHARRIREVMRRFRKSDDDVPVLFQLGKKIFSRFRSVMPVRVELYVHSFSR